MNIQASEWGELLRTAGPLGVVFTIAVIGLIGAAKWFKSTMEGTLTDARKERDEMRQLAKSQAEGFLQSLKIRDEIQEKGFDEILRELRSNPRRK